MAPHRFVYSSSRRWLADMHRYAESTRSHCSAEHPKLLLLGMALFCLWLAACTTVGKHPASPDEINAVRDGNEVAVLIRFVGEDQNGKPLRPLASDAMHIPFGLLVGDFDSGGVPTYETFPIGTWATVLAHPRYQSWVLSKVSQDEGWLTLFLRPGYYYLGLEVGYYSPAMPQWSLEVAPGAPVIYAGTFHLAGETTWDIGGRFMSGLNQDATQIQDESSLAKTVAQRDLPSLVPPVTRLVKRHSGPYILGVPPLART